jgi:hypothetical protein
MRHSQDQYQLVFGFSTSLKISFTNHTEDISFILLVDQQGKDLNFTSFSQKVSPFWKEILEVI